MSSEELPIVNKVDNSGLITIDLEEFFPKEEIISFDIADFLFERLLLKEKDFRQALESYDWKKLSGKTIAIHCSEDAIVPLWAYMLVQTHAFKNNVKSEIGTRKDVEEKITCKNIENNIRAENYIDKRVVVKGCGEKNLSENAYLALGKIILPACKSLMYGEPCSTVPIYKKQK